MRHTLTGEHKEHLRGLGVAHIPDELDIPETEYEEHKAAWRRTLPDAPDDVLHMKALGHYASKLHSQVYDRIPPSHLAKQQEIEDAKNKELMAVRSDVWKLTHVVLPGGQRATSSALDELSSTLDAHTASSKADTANLSGSIIELRDAVLASHAQRSLLLRVVRNMGAAVLIFLALIFIATLCSEFAHAQFSKINSIQWQNAGTPVTGGFYSYPFTINCSTNMTCTASGSTLSIASSGAAATGYQTIQNAAVSITQRTILNWLANSITCADNAGATRSDCQLAAQPAISDFTNAGHNHTNAAGGGTLTLAGAAFANQGTTTTVAHGNAAGNPSWAAVIEADQTLADNTTNNASTSKHGYLLKLDNTATHYMDGTGAWSTPGGGSANPTNLSVKGQTASNTVSTGAYCTSGLLLYSYTIAANTLATNDTVDIYTFITKSGTVDSPRYCIALGTVSGSGTGITDTQATTGTDTAYKMEAHVTVTGASAEATETLNQRYVSGGGAPVLDAKNATLTLAVNANIVVDVYAYNVNSTDTVRGSYFRVMQNVNK